jgi:hypothetical protein
MSEANMASLSAKKSASRNSTRVLYERTFLEALSPALSDIAKFGIKVAVNTGASDTKGCCEAVRNMVRQQGLEGSVKVAWIEGDDVLPLIQSKLSAQASKWQRIRNKKIDQGSGKGLTIFEAWMENADVGSAVRDHLKTEEFENLCTGERLRDWEWKDGIVGAQAYLGGMGIVRAFEKGADIVICGRVADASLVIGAAAWWHSWNKTQFEELANAFIAGHLIECSSYVCGGNFTGFRGFEGEGWLDIGYPIAEIGRNGEVVITKQKGTGGLVTTDTCKAQLLYEIQGPWYFNSDVTAVVDEIAFEQLSTDRVALKGVKAEPPPPTTKVGITANGGYQAEIHWFLVGLNIQAKARMLEAQIRKALGDTSRFHVLKFTLNGTAAENPIDQNSATVGFRVFAQARESSTLAPDKFLRAIMDLIMCSYPGGTWNLDFRQGFPKPVQEYFVTLLPQSDIQHVVHMHDGRDFDIAAPNITKTFPRHQPSTHSSAVSVEDFGETVRGPLGWLVHARSGDKGSNANVGFWVGHVDEYAWICKLLSTETLKELLASEYNGKQIVSRNHPCQ